jgi:hypothetical protein
LNPVAWEYLTCHPTVSAGSQEPSGAEKRRSKVSPEHIHVRWKTKMERVSCSYPLFQTSLLRIQLQLLKALNCFLETLDSRFFVAEISVNIRNFG